MSADCKMTIAEVEALLRREFPQLGGRFVIEELRAGFARVVMQTGEADLRPGGTVSGPAMFTLADCAFYMLTLAMIGPEALTVTTGCSINFMRKPEPGRLVGDARMLKLGRGLCVGDVLIHGGDPELPTAHASLTYSIPPKRV